MIRTGIFGGSFNPIHNGHISLAQQLLATTELDEIWFVVSPQNPFKQNVSLLDDKKRLEMVSTAVNSIGNSKLKASDYEFLLPRPSYMWTTLQSMSRDYPDHRFTLLIGSDNWLTFDRWYHSEDIINHHSIIIYPRQDAFVDVATLPDNVKLVDTPLFNISSTEVRLRIANGEPISDVVPNGVEDIIISEHLYQ